MSQDTATVAEVGTVLGNCAFGMGVGGNLLKGWTGDDRERWTKVPRWAVENAAALLGKSAPEIKSLEQEQELATAISDAIAENRKSEVSAKFAETADAALENMTEEARKALIAKWTGQES